MTEQRLLFNRTIPLDGENFCQVQVWHEKRSELVVKLSKKGDLGVIDTLQVFRYPLEKVELLSGALLEAKAELERRGEIEKSMKELFKKFPRDTIAAIFEDIKRENVGKP